MKLICDLSWFQTFLLTPIQQYPNSEVTHLITTDNELPTWAKNVFTSIDNSFEEVLSDPYVIECEVKEYPFNVFLGYNNGKYTLGYGCSLRTLSGLSGSKQL